MPLGAVRRFVTAGDAHGRSGLADAADVQATPIRALPGLVFHEVWRVASVPAAIDAGADAARELRLAPDRGGVLIRVCDIPPDFVHDRPDADVAAHFEEMGLKTPVGDAAHTATAHALMHQTSTVDFGIVLSGEIWLVLDDSETRLLPGDIVVQRGTRHAWSNRTDRIARIAFVLIDGERDAPRPGSA
ncbi:cupin domain-containing protein [Burkholderia multivorans]|nr:cupin domain-containing protein [Burkholderia multivorans]PRE05054.1 cupin domain-containing protein [Burkholderia multivorans]SAK17932.1 cupin 2 domain-containing protein [Burkholderia multivorans]